MHWIRKSKDDKSVLVLVGYYFDVNITLKNTWRKMGSFSLKFWTNSVIMKKSVTSFTLVHRGKLTHTCSFMSFWDFIIHNQEYSDSKYICTHVYIYIHTQTHAPMYIFNHKDLSLPHGTVRVWNAGSESIKKKKFWLQIDYPRSPNNTQSWHNDLSLQMWTCLSLKGFLLKTDAITPITPHSWTSTCTMRGWGLETVPWYKREMTEEKKWLWINELAYTPRP